jgi:hypothetical protein
VKVKGTVQALLKHGIFFVWHQALARNGLGSIILAQFVNMKGWKTESNNCLKKYDFWHFVHMGFCSRKLW